MGSYLEPKYYGSHYLLADEPAQFLDWYEEQKDKISLVWIK
jgi:hypothetical protein